MLAGSAVFGASTAANTVPSSRSGTSTFVINANAIKPAACASLNLTNVVVGSGVVNGTSGNNLLLGSSGVDSLNGRQGDDCIVGGGGIDDVNGGAGAGADICIATASSTFRNCPTIIFSP